MGKMTPHLNQTAVIKHHVVDTKGSAILDEYGQPMFAPEVTVKCRREKLDTRGATNLGQFVNFNHTYYFDESTVITKGDLVDGLEVQNIETYVDGRGNLVGYEVTV